MRDAEVGLHGLLLAAELLVADVDDCSPVLLCVHVAVVSIWSLGRLELALPTVAALTLDD
jgi:hypothetical protein